MCAFNGLLILAEIDSMTDPEVYPKYNGYIVLCITFHIAQTQTWIPTPYLYIRQELESDPMPVSESGNVFKP